MDRPDFDRYTAELLAAAKAHPLVTGLVLMGSTADEQRIDEWSDHDFALITQPGTAEQVRSELAWLPRRDSLLCLARELHDGFCGIYADGHLVEFGVTDLDGLAGWHANAYRVVLDRGSVADTMARVAARPKPLAQVDVGRDLGILLSTLVLGNGRAQRGEVLSASAAVRGKAVDLLLALLVELLPGDRSRLDNLDARRRFELVHPALGAKIERAQQLPVRECARALLKICERELGSHPDYPTRAAARVAELLS